MFRNSNATRYDVIHMYTHYMYTYPSHLSLVDIKVYRPVVKHEKIVSLVFLFFSCFRNVKFVKYFELLLTERNARGKYKMYIYTCTIILNRKQTNTYGTCRSVRTTRYLLGTFVKRAANTYYKSHYDTRVDIAHQCSISPAYALMCLIIHVCARECW